MIRTGAHRSKLSQARQQRRRRSRLLGLGGLSPDDGDKGHVQRMVDDRAAYASAYATQRRTGRHLSRDRGLSDDRQQYNNEVRAHYCILYTVYCMPHHSSHAQSSMHTMHPGRHTMPRHSAVKLTHVYVRTSSVYDDVCDIEISRHHRPAPQHRQPHTMMVPSGGSQQSPPRPLTPPRLTPPRL